jgi:formamidopyrimidine-DNA glycosylase
MPELPEVETSCRGIAPHLLQQTIVDLIVRQARLRWPIAPDLPQLLIGQQIINVSRRAKYILLETTRGTLLLHLGMSGSLRILPHATTVLKHDHVDLMLSNGLCLRLNDPRRFGAMLWTEQHPDLHPLLASLGPEPLSYQFDPQYLYSKARRKNTPTKLFIMDSKIVVGVGNIYANEALFLAGISPQLPASQLTEEQCQTLVTTIQQVLRQAIELGGTTLRNFVSSDGRPGYFKQRLFVYGRGGQACKQCSGILEEMRLGQRSTVFCPSCQT